MPNLLHDKVSLKVSDGSKMDCFVARLRDGEERRPGLIVLQEIFGVDAHIRDVTERLGRQGFVAIAPELYHRTAPGFEGDYNNSATAAPHRDALINAGIEADLRATFEWLRAQPFVKPEEISCVGYCLGGRVAFQANAMLPLKSAISFYASGMTDELLERTAALHAPHLFLWGEKDQHIPAEKRATVIGALKRAGKSYVNVEFSDAGHGFFCDVRPAYNSTAARQAWALALEFLRS